MSLLEKGYDPSDDETLILRCDEMERGASVIFHLHLQEEQIPRQPPPPAEDNSGTGGKDSRRRGGGV